MKRCAASVALALAALCWCGLGRAEGRPVLVIGGGAAFRDAMTVALTPWDLRVVPLDAPPPRPVMPSAADEARALTQERQASGLVWVAMDQNEPSLWVYDASTDQVVTRKIATAPPFDAPTAAATALSVKALLRSSTVAPAAGAHRSRRRRSAAAAARAYLAARHDSGRGAERRRTARAAVPACGARGGRTRHRS